MNNGVVHPWVAAAAERIRFGISIYPQPADWTDFIRIVQRAEKIGIDSYWSYDHPTSRADCWTALTALAMATDTIRLGTLVDCVLYRNPYLLARMAADVDRLSGGRLVLGIGMGDNTDEFAQMGIPFPSVKERQTAVAETVEILRGLWANEPFAYQGTLYQSEGVKAFHPPVQEPHIPILIAGGGEKVTLKQVAKYADVSNFGAHEWIGSAVSSEDIARKFGVLEAYLADFGRPANAVMKSQFTMPLIISETRADLERKMRAMPQDVLAWCGDALFAGTPEEVIAFYRDLEAAGFRYFIGNILDGDEESIELLGTAVAPAFA